MKSLNKTFESDDQSESLSKRITKSDIYLKNEDEIRDKDDIDVEERLRET